MKTKYKILIAFTILYIIFIEICIWAATHNWYVSSFVKYNVTVLGTIVGICLSLNWLFTVLWEIDL